MVIGLYDQTGKSNNIELSDYMMTHLEQEISGLKELVKSMFWLAICNADLARSDRLKQYNLMPSDIRAAVEAQNTQVAAGVLETCLQPVNSI